MAKGPDLSDPIIAWVTAWVIILVTGFEAVGTGVICPCAGGKGFAAPGTQGGFNGVDACFKAGGAKEMGEEMFNRGGGRLRPKPDVAAANQALVGEKGGKRPFPCTRNEC